MKKIVSIIIIVFVSLNLNAQEKTTEKDSIKKLTEILNFKEKLEDKALVDRYQLTYELYLENPFS